MSNGKQTEKNWEKKLLQRFEKEEKKSKKRKKKLDRRMAEDNENTEGKRGKRVEELFLGQRQLGQNLRIMGRATKDIYNFINKKALKSRKEIFGYKEGGKIKKSSHSRGFSQHD